MLRHRVFIAINLPDNIKKALAKYQKKFSELPVKWVKEKNLHLTVLFLGYLTDVEIQKVCEISKKVSQNIKPFQIVLNKITYGPKEINIEDIRTLGEIPRMIWLKGEKSKELSELRSKLELEITKNINYKKDFKEVIPHITLGRIRKWQFKNLDLDEIPEISEEISLIVDVNSIEIMESNLRRSGPEYIILESVELGSNL